MPLGERIGDKSESRYCGVETDFDDDMPNLLYRNISAGGFDFVVSTLMDPSYRPSLVQKDGSKSIALPFAGSDLVLSPSQWSGHVVGKISSWIDLDSGDEKLRVDSEITLKQEIAWASHLSLQACLLPVPKGTKCGNYARCVNQILQSLNNMQLWLRIPLEKADEDDASGGKSEMCGLADSWELWNSFRCFCEHHSQLSIALEILSSLPSENSLGRWFGEPVKAAIIHTDSFLTNARGYPCLSKRHQRLVTSFFNYSVQIILSGKRGQTSGHSGTSIDQADGLQRHPLKSYLDYVGYLYQKMDPLSEQERFEVTGISYSPHCNHSWIIWRLRHMKLSRKIPSNMHRYGSIKTVLYHSHSLIICFIYLNNICGCFCNIIYILNQEKDCVVYYRLFRPDFVDLVGCEQNFLLLKTG